MYFVMIKGPSGIPTLLRADTEDEFRQEIRRFIKDSWWMVEKQDIATEIQSALNEGDEREALELLCEWTDEELTFFDDF